LRHIYSTHAKQEDFDSNKVKSIFLESPSVPQLVDLRISTYCPGYHHVDRSRI
jgi:hypothetical protein